jgi:lambda family phage portal protein
MTQEKGFIDRLLYVIAPNQALKREQARRALRAYDAASKGTRRTSSWGARGTSQNAEVYAAAQTLRDRSRELSRNNPFVKRAIQSMSNNVVGTGIRAKINSKNKRQKDKVYQDWVNWFETTDCDNDSRKNGYGIQKMVMRAVSESGDCLIIKKWDRSRSVPIKLQVLEIDYLDVNKNTLSSSGLNSDGSYDFMGVRFNKKGDRIGYWLFDKHPGDPMSFSKVNSTLIKAENVIHVFEQLRPGQQLGVPFGVSSFLRVRDMDEYQDAQVVKQKVAACYSAFVSTESDPASSSADVDEFERMEPGTINHLRPGESVTFGNPPSVENFGEFSRTILQSIAAGFGTTYENLTGDLNNVNFSSGRMGWIEHHRNIEDWQYNIMIPQLCQKVWMWFLEGYELVQNGGRPNVTATWVPPRREMIDPVKEISALGEAVRMGFMSPQDAILEQGRDPEEVLAEFAAWNEKIDSMGIVLASDPRQDIQPTGIGAGRPADTGENQDDNEDIPN